MPTETVHNLGTRRLGGDDRLIDRREAARITGISVATFETDASRPRLGIPHIKLGRMVRYRLSDIEAWINSDTIAAKV